jgi:hypothetical protein
VTEATRVDCPPRFLLGLRWGRIVGGRSFRIAAGLTLIGVALVLVTIMLGG